MQRSWKILSDSGSTSASSTEANRSSPSVTNSSSDDSNCSNQTVHSMSTTMASPPTNSLSPPDPASPPEKEPPPVMNYITTPQMAETTLQRLRQRLTCPTVRNAPNSESAMRSLELLRITIQGSFDKDIDVIIKNYMEMYFKPAFSNIKENLGESAVSNEMLQKMSCALLENAKAQYNVFRLRASQGSCFVPHVSTTAAAASVSAAASTSDLVPLQRVAVKRSAMIGTSALTINGNNQNGSQPKRAFSSISARPQMAPNQNQSQTPERRTQNNAPLLQGFQPVRPAPPITSSSSNAPTRRQIFWNTAHISTSTKFVLDVQANQAFGFGSDGRERLASKHPELIRYLPDTEDRNWLISQSIIAQQNRNTRFLFLIFDEVCNLQQTHEVYRNKTNINLSLMRTFLVPEFMIQKMRHFFVDLNIKSRGLITNSFSMALTSTRNNSNNSNDNNIPNANSTQTNANSQLRTALLQGQQTTQLQQQQQQQQHQQPSSASDDVIMSSGSSSSNDFVTTTTQNDNTHNSSGGSNHSSLQQQSGKTSTLSSSHATLTALLNNNTANSSNASMSSGNSNKATTKSNEKSSSSSGSGSGTSSRK